jgi:hypothetical protein
MKRGALTPTPKNLVCDVSARLLVTSHLLLLVLCLARGLDFSVGTSYSRMMWSMADKLFLLISALSAFRTWNGKQGL